MPGPFPGMDPYLENPARWYSAHNKLITYIEAALNRVLPSPYVAESEMRCYIDSPSDFIRPDLSVFEPPRPTASLSGRGGTAVVEPVDPAMTLRLYAREEVKEAYLNIINMVERGRIVTMIELLSPTNKTLRNQGREVYVQKQQEALASRTHLIEIDLLRAGTHTIAVPKEQFEEYSYNYLVCLHRAGRGQEYEVWLNTLRQRLPRIAVPLDPGVADVVLDLQAVFDRNYDEGAYARKIDYTHEPVPPLTPEDTLWADKLLRERALRA